MNSIISLASIGDCCIDIYPIQNRKFPGGSAFNVAIQSQKAGAQSSLISAIGNDEYGKEFQTICERNQINTDYLSVQNGQTSSIEIRNSQNGENTFDNWKLGVLENFRLPNDCQNFLKHHDVARAVYYKPTSQFFHQFCEMEFPSTIKVGDFAGDSEYSEGIESIRKYIDQLDIVFKSLDSPDDPSLPYLQKLSDSLRKMVVVLLGKYGSIVFHHGTQFQQSSQHIQAIDTNGAGDAYSAYFLKHYLQTKNIQEAMQKGTKAAEATIKYRGATQSPIT